MMLCVSLALSLYLYLYLYLYVWHEIFKTKCLRNVRAWEQDREREWMINRWDGKYLHYIPITNKMWWNLMRKLMEDTHTHAQMKNWEKKVKKKYVEMETQQHDQLIRDCRLHSRRIFACQSIVCLFNQDRTAH